MLKINASAKSLVERLCDLKIYAISVLSFYWIRMRTRQGDPQSREPCPSVYNCRTVPRYTSHLLGVGSICGLGPDLVGIHSISLSARYRVAACSTTLTQGLENIQTARGHNCTRIFALSPVWEKEFLAPPRPVAPRTLSILFVAWTVMANLLKLRRIKSGRLLLDYFVTNSMNRT